MHDDRWLGWAGLILAFIIFQVVRAVLRGAKNAQSGMARMNAAAERILKERGTPAANPLPRTKPTHAKPINPRHQSPAKPRPATVPAVIRRGTMLAGAPEPVIQRRR